MFQQYETKFRPLFNEYSCTASKIKLEWSEINNEKIYIGLKIESFINLCMENIKAYTKMVELENQYNKDHLQEAEGYKRLAMLYEKQGEFEKSVLICKEAIIMGDKKTMPERLLRMIKKAHREPTQEEYRLIQRNN